MAIQTFSSFYYLKDEITGANQNLNFDEGSGEVLAQINIGQYTPTDLALEVKKALDASSTIPQEYSVSFDRVTRKITISATNNFSLLISTGSQLGTSIFPILGFTGNDLTGSNSYTGDKPLGISFEPQMKLQDYVAPGFKKQIIQPSVNESASGEVEVLTFGTRSFIEFSIPIVTNDLSFFDKTIFNPNKTGVEDTLDFLDFVIKKSAFEFNPDKDNPLTFHTLIIERSNFGSEGTGFFLRERTRENIIDIYETGLLRFRVRE